MDKLSFSLESYLDAVYELSAGGGGARLTDIARRMNVTKSTASAAMNSLAERGFITNERYKNIFLTSDGIALASEVTKKHETILKYLTDVLGINPDVADVDACAIEHIVSRDVVNAMKKALR
ncbi:MAG: metal-dependent transcriptional regulator [Lactobacillales bacterium]|jgi:Mn-dependent DtxR family transcriptional regulator|nr:metal-dependent transcriptional regulator [Lactobacillales bacterium]